MLRNVVNLSQKEDKLWLPRDYFMIELLRRGDGTGNIPKENIFPAYDVVLITFGFIRDRLNMEIFILNQHYSQVDIIYDDPNVKSFTNFSDQFVYITLIKNFWQLVSSSWNFKLEFSKSDYPHEVIKFARRQDMKSLIPATTSIFIDNKGNLCAYVDRISVDVGRESFYPMKLTYWESLQHITRASLVKNLKFLEWNFTSYKSKEVEYFA